jgi:hypothetical protein
LDLFYLCRTNPTEGKIPMVLLIGGALWLSSTAAFLALCSLATDDPEEAALQERDEAHEQLDRDLGWER